jgi:hypothetical protein
VPDGVTRFRWERAVIERGPASPTTRLLLLVLGTHVNRDGLAWPSQKTLAQETGLSERVIPQHMASAEVLGWIERTSRRVAGQKWALHCYRIRIPPAGTERPSVPSLGEGTAPRSVPRAVPPPDGTEPGANGTEPHAQGTEPERGGALNDVPSNTEVITAANTQQNTAAQNQPSDDEGSGEHVKGKDNGNSNGKDGLKGKGPLYWRQHLGLRQQREGEGIGDYIAFIMREVEKLRSVSEGSAPR